MDKSAVITRRNGNIRYKYTVTIFNTSTTGYTQGTFEKLDSALRCALDRKPVTVSIRNILKGNSSWHRLNCKGK